jgi:hypothetical protein
MTWIRLDDQFIDHPKILAISDEAFRAYVSGLCYASRYLTDGLLPNAALSKICSKRARKVLTEAQLWHDHEEGIMINDFLEYNPSKEDTERKRAQAAERMKRLRGSTQ